LVNAAWLAGRIPPINPIKREKAIPVIRSCGVRRKAKIISENVVKLIVPVTPERASLMASIPKRQPRRPPRRARQSDSIMNETKIARREKPRTRSIAISCVRAETVAYIVFIAPKLAPIAIITPMNNPKNLMGAAVDVCCS